MTEQELTAIRERTEAAIYNSSTNPIPYEFWRVIDKILRQDIPALISEVERVREELERTERIGGMFTHAGVRTFEELTAAKQERDELKAQAETWDGFIAHQNREIEKLKAKVAEWEEKYDRAFDNAAEAEAKVEALERGINQSCYLCVHRKGEGWDIFDEWVCDLGMKYADKEYGNWHCDNWQFDYARFTTPDSEEVGE